MHNTSPFLEQYENAVLAFWKEVKKLKFPIGKLLKNEENPMVESFIRDDNDGDYFYRTEFHLYPHKDDDHGFELKFELYSEFLFHKDQYFELNIKVNGRELKYLDDITAFTTLLKTKGVRVKDIEDFMEALPEEPKRCNLGVGCEESGVCYADANSQQEKCGKL